MAMSSSSPFTTLLPLNYSRQLPTKKTGKFFRLTCSASMQTEEKTDAAEIKSRDKWELGKLALVAVAAGVLIIGTPQEAMAAKSGGRVGGQAFRSSAPRSSGPRINNSRTNIYINPPVAPPLVGGYGYGVYGGYGWSPFSFFAPGPSVAVGIGGGFDIFVALFAFSALAAIVSRFRGNRNYDDEDDD